jgi:putative transposase
MKRFKSAGQVQRFLSIHDPIANLFHLPRHRLSASAYRAARAQAFASWVEVAGAPLWQRDLDRLATKALLHPAAVPSSST